MIDRTTNQMMPTTMTAVATKIAPRMIGLLVVGAMGSMMPLKVTGGGTDHLCMGLLAFLPATVVVAVVAVLVIAGFSAGRPSPVLLRVEDRVRRRR